jgi:hypothetical protein
MEEDSFQKQHNDFIIAALETVCKANASGNSQKYCRSTIHVGQKRKKRVEG